MPQLRPLSVCLALLTACASSSRAPQKIATDPASLLHAIAADATRPDAEMRRTLSYAGGEPYEVRIHSSRLAPLMRADYTANDREALETALASSMTIRLDSRGLSQAADRDAVTGEGAETDPTHYDAVWVRDNLWVALGLAATPGAETSATKLILTLADYFSSPAQIARFESIIRDPKPLAESPHGAMNGVHIRFDRRSVDFADVQENGRAQPWNHKQNDALGLFLDLYCREILAGRVNARDLTPARKKLFTLFPKYFERTKFNTMEDAGSWEEIERTNTSSIALVTSGLERLALLSPKLYPSIGTPVARKRVSHLIDLGYARIRKQLALGGESPDYPPSDPHFRKADAALVNLIYPAKLARLGRADFHTVLRIVQPLIGEIGVRRYLGDSYQAGNFWFIANANTDDTSSRQAFIERAKKGLTGTEAQWFFDSWLSVAYAELNARFPDPHYRAEQLKHLNRALAQVTGGTREHPVLGADGKPVPFDALPESYNTVVDPTTGAHHFVPSPITPLNWAKATLRLALSRI